MALLIKDEGYKGEFFNPTSVDSLANAIQNIVTNEAYRVSLGQANYKAAIAFPMSVITDMYLNNFERIAYEKSTSKSDTVTV